MEFLTIDEAAETLKVTRQTVSKYINENKLNAIKINKSYRIALEDFNSFLVSMSLSLEPSTKYLKRSKNCTLVYENKMDEFEIIHSLHSIEFSPLELSPQHNGNLFFKGDNYIVLKKMLDNYRGMIDLVYIDPPFGTGQVFSSINSEPAYSDKVIDSDFLEFLRKRLVLIREMLSEQGSIYLHIDKKIGHYVRVLMDEVFGANNFINDITRIKCNPKNFSRNAYGNFSDMILYYAKNRDKQVWNDITDKMTKEKREELFPRKHPKFGYYTTHPIHAPGKTEDGDTGLPWKGMLPPPGRHWRYNREVLDELDAKGLIEWSATGNPRKIVLAKDHQGFKIQDVWEFKDKGLSLVDYPTQKNDSLLERIILNSSNPDSIVLDCFAGSGSTLRAANKFGRKWIGVDQSDFAFGVIRDTFKRDNIYCDYYETIVSD